jgi:hypothetical protein
MQPLCRVAAQGLFVSTCSMGAEHMSNEEFHFAELFLIALALTSVTVLTHYAGMNCARIYFRRLWAHSAKIWFGGRHGIMVGIVAIMMATHCIEIFIWAGLYYLRGMLPTWRTSVYFSIANYSTIGSNDITLSLHWRGLGGFEAICAMLMFGWSTALLAAVIMKIHGMDE